MTKLNYEPMYKVSFLESFSHILLSYYKEQKSYTAKRHCWFKWNELYNISKPVHRCHRKKYIFLL